MTAKKKIALSAVSVVVLVAACCGYCVYRTVYVTIPDSYAAWATGDLVVEYMKMHSNVWPRGWDDLRLAKESLQRRGRPIRWQFEDLPRRIKIDWGADPARLAQTKWRGEDISFRVVTKADGSPVDSRWGEDTEPNRKIYEYLREGDPQAR